MNRKRPCTKDTKLEALVLEKVKEVLGNVPTKPQEPQAILKPVLKWVGGKTQILENVLQLFPGQMANYREPFLGGGSVLLGLLSKCKDKSIQVAGKVYASDVNGNLIAMYTNIQKNTEQLIAELRKLSDAFGAIKTLNGSRTPATVEAATESQETYYYWIRKCFNSLTTEEKQTPAASAMLIFMNKTCFRGVYREGPNGINVPFGNYTNPTILDEAHIRQVAELIQPVIFTTQSFEQSLAMVQAGDFVYLDPPYAPETEKSFVGYVADGFNADKHKALFKLCQDIRAKGAKLVMSNADVALVKNAFQAPTFSTTIVSCRRAIHSKDPTSRTNEVLIQG